MGTPPPTPAQAVEHLAQGVFPLRSILAHKRQVGRHKRPLIIGHITRISFSFHALSIPYSGTKVHNRLYKVFLRSSLCLERSFQPVVIHQRRVAQQFTRGSISDQPAFVENDRPWTEIPHQAHIVTGDQHSMGQFAQ
jgi:hypothetical protein